MRGKQYRLNITPVLEGERPADGDRGLAPRAGEEFGAVADHDRLRVAVGLPH